VPREERVAETKEGAVASITRALFAPSELAAPGEARVNVALFPAASLIVPLFRAREDVET